MGFLRSGEVTSRQRLSSLTRDRLAGAHLPFCQAFGDKPRAPLSPGPPIVGASRVPRTHPRESSRVPCRPHKRPGLSSLMPHPTLKGRDSLVP